MLVLIDFLKKHKEKGEPTFTSGIRFIYTNGYVELEQAELCSNHSKGKTYIT